jgi:hypothetical protein
VSEVLSNGIRAGGFIQSEANGDRSRARVDVAGGSGGGTVWYAGTVLGKITTGGQYTASPASGADGSETAVAILWDDVDVTDGDALQVAVLARDAEVRAEDLSYHASVDADMEKAAKWAQLLQVGIIVRE